MKLYMVKLEPGDWDFGKEEGYLKLIMHISEQHAVEIKVYDQMNLQNFRVAVWQKWEILNKNHDWQQSLILFEGAFRRLLDDQDIFQWTSETVIRFKIWCNRFNLKHSIEMLRMTDKITYEDAIEIINECWVLDPIMNT